MSEENVEVCRTAYAARIRDGLVVYLAAFSNVEQALEAVGLAE